MAPFCSAGLQCPDAAEASGATGRTVHGTAQAATVSQLQRAGQTGASSQAIDPALDAQPEPLQQLARRTAIAAAADLRPEHCSSQRNSSYANRAFSAWLEVRSRIALHGAEKAPMALSPLTPRWRRTPRCRAGSIRRLTGRSAELRSALRTDYGVRDVEVEKWRSCHASLLPIVLERAVEVTAPQGDDGLGHWPTSRVTTSKTAAAVFSPGVQASLSGSSGRCRPIFSLIANNSALSFRKRWYSSISAWAFRQAEGEGNDSATVLPPALRVRRTWGSCPGPLGLAQIAEGSELAKDPGAFGFQLQQRIRHPGGLPVLRVSQHSEQSHGEGNRPLRHSYVAHPGLRAPQPSGPASGKIVFSKP